MAALSQQKTVVSKDWENREFVEMVSLNMRKLVDFLNKFDVSVRYKLSKVNEKMEQLERQVEYLEQCYASMNPSAEAAGQ